MIDLNSKIEEHLKSNPGEYKWITFAEQLGVSAITVSSVLLQLEAEGLVRREGARRYWVDRGFSAPIDYTDAEALLNNCVADLKAISFCSVNAAQLLNKIAPKVYDIFTLHRAVPLAGGTIARCAATKQILYFKFTSEVAKCNS